MLEEIILSYLILPYQDIEQIRNSVMNDVRFKVVYSSEQRNTHLLKGEPFPLVSCRKGWFAIMFIALCRHGCFGHVPSSLLLNGGRLCKLFTHTKTVLFLTFYFDEIKIYMLHIHNSFRNTISKWSVKQKQISRIHIIMAGTF